MTSGSDRAKDYGSGNISTRDFEWILIRGSEDIFTQWTKASRKVFGVDEGDTIARKQMKAVVMQLQLELMNYSHNSGRKDDEYADMQYWKVAFDISRGRAIEVINDMCLRLEQVAPLSTPSSIDMSTSLPDSNFFSSIENYVGITQGWLLLQVTDAKHWPVEAGPWSGSSILPRATYIPPANAPSPGGESSGDILQVTIGHQPFEDILRVIESRT
jgi:hypothetical protein